MMYSYNPYYECYLAHYGVLGMHWGIRRYQPYTHGQKGVFKGIKKQRRADVKSLKRDLNAYKKAGDELAVENTKKAIKDTKKSYKSLLKENQEVFDKENFEAYKDEIANEGSIKEVDRWKNRLSSEQLATATRRFTAENAFEEAKINNRAAIAKMQKAADTINAVANIGGAAINVMDTVNTIHNMYSTDDSVRKLSREATASAALERLKTASQIAVPSTLSKDLFSKKQISELTKYQEKKQAIDNAQKIEAAKTQRALTEINIQKAVQEAAKATAETSKANKTSYMNQMDILNRRASEVKAASDRAKAASQSYLSVLSERTKAANDRATAAKNEYDNIMRSFADREVRKNS